MITVVGDLDEENIDRYSLTVQAENDQATGAPPVTVSVINHFATYIPMHQSPLKNNRIAIPVCN